MRVVWTSTAIARLESIEDYIATDDPDAAVRFVEQLIDVGDSLSGSPSRGRTIPELPGSGLREVIHRGYRIVYRLTATRVEILTVFEGHRLVRVDELT